MTKKRFRLRLSELGNGMITDTQKRKDLFFEKEFLDVTLPQANEWLNELAEENRYLREALKELKEIGDYQALRIKELQEFEDTVFNSLDGKIKRGEKAIEWGESVGADIGAMGFHIELLKQFKKELEE